MDNESASVIDPIRFRAYHHLVIWVRTVESHVAALLRKLDAADRGGFAGTADERRRGSDAGDEFDAQRRSTDGPVPPTTEEMPVDYKLELVILPVSDVDRAKAFYTEQMGFRLDVDHAPNEQFRVVQMTPPGSACSVTVGTGLTTAEPGCYRGTHLVVADIEAARAELVGRGVAVGEIRHFDGREWIPGPHPERADFGSFAEIADPDGNTWTLQEAAHEAADVT